MSEKLPSFLKPYFWDVDYEKVDLEKNRDYVIKRVIDRGNLRSVRWALARYPLERIKEVVLHSRDISRKTANFWANFLGLPHKLVTCLRKPYSRIPFGL